ncbi:MAG: serine/threonine protein kinase [Lentisphaeraceae bacterium]|nr:serine/threonine protein kinase [Lentisphaeraceae bacterium]
MQSTNDNFDNVEFSKVCYNLDESLGSVYDEMYKQEQEDAEEVEGNRYLIKEKIATGGLKDIYCAFDQKTQRDIAMAFAREDLSNHQYLEQFLHESTITALLEHPNIIPVYDVGDEEKPFFTMKMVRGQNLHHFLFQEPDKLTRIQLLKIFNRICDAVAYAHSRGVIHLDLKPDNIKLDAYGEVLLHDWGLAKRIFIPENDSNTMPVDNIVISNIIQGTPSYMAPEQFTGNSGLSDQRTDIYSLGGILYCILTAQHPFDSSSKQELINRQIREPIKLCPERKIPESLNAVTLKAMSNNPDDRYQSVTDLQREIDRYLDGFATDAESAGFLKQFSLLIKRNKKSCALITFSIILIISIVVIFISKLKKAQKETSDALVQTNLNFEMYKKEKEEKARIANSASESIENLSLIPDRSNYSSIMRQIEIALKASPGNPSIYRKKVLTHIFYEEFNKAIEEYQLSNKVAFLDLAMPILKKYGALKKDSEKLSDTDFLEMVQDLEAAENRWIAGALIIARLKIIRGKEPRIQFMKKVFQKCNPKQENWHWDFKTEDGFIFSYLSLKGHKDVYNFMGIAGRYLSVLDLTDCGRIYPQDLSLLYVKKIIVKGSVVRRLHKFNDIKGLEEIITDKRQFTAEQIKVLEEIKVTEE